MPTDPQLVRGHGCHPGGKRALTGTRHDRQPITGQQKRASSQGGSSMPWIGSRDRRCRASDYVRRELGDKGDNCPERGQTGSRLHSRPPVGEVPMT